ncbi:MAG: inactive transglutaminase family protein [Desulfobacterales bacterium]
MKNLHLYLLCIVLAALGIFCFVYKTAVLKFPLKPHQESVLWTVEAHISFEAKTGPMKIELFIPRNHPSATIVNENFISKGFGLKTRLEEGNRKVIWSKRKGSGPYHLYYRAVIRQTGDGWQNGYPSYTRKKPEIKITGFQGTNREAAETLISEIYSKSADMESFVSDLLTQLKHPETSELVKYFSNNLNMNEEKVNLAVQILALTGVPAHAGHGIKLNQETRSAQVVHWLEVYDKDVWYPFNLESGEKGVPDHYLIWWRGMAPLLSVKGVKKEKAIISVVPNPEETLFVVMARDKADAPFLVRFSLFSLPLETQAVYRVLLLVPIGAFLMVLLRNAVGVRTFGTFMPVLIALAFRETQLLWGIILFTIIIGAGLGIRRYLEQLKLLVVPRLAAVLIVVIMLMTSISIITHLLGVDRGISVALFPMVILTMVIERMSIVWEEVGPGDALRQGFGTLIAASGVYLVMSIELLGYMIFVFPELVFIILAATLLMGRYSGYRVTDIFRFGALIKGNE